MIEHASHKFLEASVMVWEFDVSYLRLGKAEDRGRLKMGIVLNAFGECSENASKCLCEKQCFLSWIESLNSIIF